MFGFNNGTFGGQKTTQTENNYKKSNEKVKTPASKIQQSLNEIKQITESNQQNLNEIKQTIENNQQKLIEIITDLRKQSEETKETKPKLTFGEVDPNTSGKKSFEVSSDGQAHYDANHQNSNQNSQMPSISSGSSNPPKDLKKILQSLGNSRGAK